MIIRGEFSLEDIGVWISPQGEIHPVYPDKTHEQVAQEIVHDPNAFEAMEHLVRLGWIRVSMGTLFHVHTFAGGRMDIVKKFITDRRPLYKDTAVELQDHRSTKLVPVDDLLKD